MAPPVDINYLAVLVAAIASMFVGFLWYGPLFGKTWMKLMGFSEATMKKMKMTATKAYVIAFIVALVSAYVLARFVDYIQAATMGDAIAAAFWIWLGFMTPLNLGSVLWENKPMKLFLINVAHNLVALIIAAIILTIWV